MKRKKILVVYTIALLNLLLFGSVSKTKAVEKPSSENDTDITKVPIFDPINPSQEVTPIDVENEPIPYKIVKKEKLKPSKIIKKKPVRIKKTKTSDQSITIEKIQIKKNGRKLFLTEDFFKKNIILKTDKDFTGGNDNLDKDTYLGQLAKGLSGVALYGTKN